MDGLNAGGAWARSSTVVIVRAITRHSEKSAGTREGRNSGIACGSTKVYVSSERTLA